MGMTATVVPRICDLAVPASRSGRLLVLIYHRVRPRPDALFPAEVDGEAFRRQMRLIREFCAPVSLADGVAGLRAGRLPARACAVTFDDGYADNAEVALPILEELGVPATFFVATGFLDGGRMWNDSVIEALRAAPAGPLDLAMLGLGSFQLSDPASRRVAAVEIIRVVKHRAPAERQRLVDAVSEALGVVLPDDLMMTSEQVRAIADAGMEVGGHTVHHPILVTLSDDEAREEISSSRQRLVEITGRPVTGFAYPNGRPGRDYSDRDRNLVERLGFNYAVSTTRGVGHRGSDMFQIPRFTPWDRNGMRWLGRLVLEYGNPR